MPAKTVAARKAKGTVVAVSDRSCKSCGNTNYSAYNHNIGTCRPCYLERGKKHRRANHVRHLERMKVWAADAKQNRPKWRWAAYQYASIKKRAIKAGLAFDLTREWLEENAVDMCPALGLQLDYRNSGNPVDSSPSVDRLIPANGYTKSNCVVISLKANRIKNDATYDEIKQVSQWLEQQLR